MEEKKLMNNGVTHSGSRFFWQQAQLIDRRTSERYARVLLRGPELPSDVAVGQFVLVRYSDDPCLPRAFSVMSSSDLGLELFVKTAGRVREKFRTAPMGTVFEVRGPYGTPYADKISLDRKYILVGGGSGAAPLLHFRRQYPNHVAGEVYGFRTEDACGLLNEIELTVESTTGLRAHEQLRSIWRPGLGILACGPEPMLRLLAQEYRQQPDVYVSLEARIGCGVGTCLGCSIHTSTGMQRICKEGPLFALEELPWLI
ncbi:dihydroorotate dehydrogenase [Candidatus Bipolaricaulota bacterium]|nr:dihydroorotate dehydrogenase [Candidatus Bipolaricaulota bacterium]